MDLEHIFTPKRAFISKMKNMHTLDKSAVTKKQGLLMQKIKQEVQKLFASPRIQNIFEETFKSNFLSLEKPFSVQNQNFQKNQAKSLSETLTRPHFIIRKRSMDFKDKGLIVPATNLSFTPQNPSIPTMTHIQSPAGFITNNPIQRPNVGYGYTSPIRIIPMMPPLGVFSREQGLKFGEIPSMNIVNNFTNIQNFPTQKHQAKNVHLYQGKLTNKSTQNSEKREIKEINLNINSKTQVDQEKLMKKQMMMKLNQKKLQVQGIK